MRQNRRIQLGWASAPAAETLAAVLALLLCGTPARSKSCSALSGAPLEIGGRAASRLLLNRVKPNYPPIARINYIRGHVRLLVTVGCDGKVASAHVLHGHPFLALAALQAIRRWVYRPFITPSGPSPFQTRVDVNFSLAVPHSVGRFPPRPEEFLERGIQPPRLRSDPPKTAAPAGSITVRVLVNSKGRVADCTLVSGNPQQFEAAKRIVSRWRFQPAKWGNLKVPWYIDIKLPAGHPASPTPAVALVGR